MDKDLMAIALMTVGSAIAGVGYILHAYYIYKERGKNE